MAYIVRTNLDVIARHIGIQTPERFRSGGYLTKKILEKINAVAQEPFML